MIEELSHLFGLKSLVADRGGSVCWSRIGGLEDWSGVEGDDDGPREGWERVVSPSVGDEGVSEGEEVERVGGREVRWRLDLRVEGWSEVDIGGFDGEGGEEGLELADSLRDWRESRVWVGGRRRRAEGGGSVGGGDGCEGGVGGHRRICWSSSGRRRCS